VDAIHLPNAISLPTTFGAPGLALPPGHIVQALVLELIESDVFRLQLPQAVVDVRSDVTLTPGSTVTVATKGSGANARLVIYADDARPAAPSASTTPPTANAAPQTVAGKHPVGEAIIIARAASGAVPKAPLAPLVAGDALTARDAPVIRNAPVVRDAPPIVSTRTPEVPRSITPQQALGEAVRSAAARQIGLAPLLADVEQVVQAPTLPAPVKQAAQQVLALRVPLDEKLTAADVKQAFVRSGVLLEAKIATESKATVPSAPGASADLKAALIVFREVLKVWSGETAPLRTSAPPPLPSAPAHAEAVRPQLSDAASIRQLASALAGTTDELLPLPATAPLSPEQATNLAKSVAAALHGQMPPEHSSNGGPPPPYRGASLVAQQPAPATIMPDTPPHETAERLLSATDGAIARTTLLQAASLPEQGGAQRIDSAQRWTFEVPFQAPQGTGIAQFEVSRDGRAAKDEQRAPVWRARFSLDLEPMGPVHAMIALAGERASVTLWAERDTTASKLNENAAMLSEALRAARLEPADFQFRVGTPPVVARAAAPGRFMDRAT
jgi:hypothetical protein